MSGWVKVKKGEITLDHNSTASIVSIVVSKNHEVSQGGPLEVVEEVLYLDYGQWNNLKEAINITEDLD